MSTTHYRTSEGVYIGGFGDGATSPIGGIECPAPGRADAVWTGTAWDSTAPSLADLRANLSMSFGQMIRGLVKEEWITMAEGRSWMNDRILPAAVITLINSLPEANRFDAEVLGKVPSVVLRSNALVVALGVAAEKTPAELDTFFQTYSVV